MHYTALEYGKLFFEKYASRENLNIIEIGSQDVNGSLRSYSPSNSKYLGLDLNEGKSVDIVIKDPYHFPFPDDYADIIITTSCFEHTNFFWLSFIEALRILKPDGLIYVNAPSNGMYHRYPTDNWRFYPDAGKALVEYATLNNMKDVVMLESFIDASSDEGWNDFVAVFLKDKQYANLYKNRIFNSAPERLKPTNIWSYGTDNIINYEEYAPKNNVAEQPNTKNIVTETLNTTAQKACKDHTLLCLAILIPIILFLILKLYSKKK